MKFLLELFCPYVRPILKKQPEKGFTVIELMVVIACVAILTAATGPSFLEYLRDAGLKKAVYQLSGDLYRTKSQAIKQKTVRSINLDQGNNTYTCTNPNRTVDLAAFWGTVTFTNNPDGGPDAFSATISFENRGLSGLVPAITTQAYLTNQVAGPLGGGDGRLFRVQVSAAGAVSIHEWRDGNWIQ